MTVPALCLVLAILVWVLGRNGLRASPQPYSGLPSRPLLCRLARWGRFLIPVLILGLVLAPLAYPFGGEIVFDPAALVESIRQTLQMIETVETLRRQYEHMIEMAKGLPHSLFDRYGLVWTPWLTGFPTSDVYQMNGAWSRGLHGSPEWETGYRQMTEHLDQYGPDLEQQVGPLEAIRLKRRQAGLESLDGENLLATHLKGTIWLHSKLSEEKVTNLEGDILSGAYLTTTQQLQGLNTSNVMLLRATTDTNKLLAATLGQQLMESRARRDAEAEQTNNHIYYLRRAPQFHEELTGTITNTLTSFRMP